MHTVHRPTIAVTVEDHGARPDTLTPYDCCTSSVPPRIGLCTRPKGHDGLHQAGMGFTPDQRIEVCATWDDDRSTDDD